MPFQKGDYLLVDYTIIDKDEGRVLETTIEEKAKEAGIYRPDEIYEPRLIILGETRLFEPVEQALLNAKEGEEITVEVPPEKAFGHRDPSKIRIISIREFYRIGRLPKVGDIVEINNQQARVISISGGRVTLDFNHPLAGKTLIVNLKVVKKLETQEEKAKYLIKQFLPRLDVGKIHVEFSQDGSVLTVRLPIETLFIENIGTLRVRIANELAERFQGLSKVVYIDEIEVRKPEEKAEEKKAEEK